MENTSNKSTQVEGKDTKFANSAPVEITRTFRAPVEQIWKAWSEPALMEQWWGPENYTCPESNIDFRVGGTNFTAMQGPDGKIIWGTGKYQEIIPYKKIVCTDSFADEDGDVISAKEAGMPGNWPKECLQTIQFEKQGDSTIMTLKHEGIPLEMHDDCVDGWNSSFNKLEKLVARN